ncbi:MAG TPA: hypothetical protein VG456_12735, partial [Candidatus Sulfopaludibacter sp.]|nr:hypothetical protein [Candidatus Sulfopaludibacter sp.]
FVDASGGFKLLNVAAGKYTAVVKPLPDNGYVKTVQVDGVTAAEGVVDFTRGARGSRLKIVASTGAAQMSGKVLDKDGQALAGSIAFVWLMADSKELKEESMIPVEPDGSYSRKGIRPGKYRVFAMDLMHFAGLGTIRGNDLSDVFARGEEVEFKEGDKLTKDIKILEKEAAHDKK